MINTDMKKYPYYKYGEENSYGQRVLSKVPVGNLTMALYVASQYIQDNINYKGCNYIALTRDKVDDSMVVEDNGHKLKVLYVNTYGRLNQVFLALME